MLNAAKQLFLAHGYDATSMDAVARQATVTKQMVYRYFPSKANLSATLIQREKQKNAA
ncbi:helix-turn-helix transcriptional regulator [Desulfuromonas acetoxidans]|nr:helix-turn-helix domain-containing protein [Desulfuromonas acetoxidans]MBF0647033.1 helix-turn-helix transcriptional regulator [Desulfuromonas acetoxidans]NVD24358.1 helix-turn-helix transcriptional regulator [Desulfuromonas acetoxidans]NVE14871.1 helix-turn-helix transcriptional regulator [Desulfuromonas acetoxidans]